MWHLEPPTGSEVTKKAEYILVNTTTKVCFNAVSYFYVSSWVALVCPSLCISKFTDLQQAGKSEQTV